jgi:ribosome biogenesis protein MAK21
MLLKMAKKKNRRQTEVSVSALKELFLEHILTNKKLSTFYSTIEKLKKEENYQEKLSDDLLFEIYTDDFIHRKYSELIEIINDIVINDPLQAIKKKYLNIILEMLTRKAEKEEKLLEILINKLGDPDVEVSNFVIKLLKTLQMSHPKMSLIILQNVQNFLSKLPEGNNNSKYYCLVFLSNMNVINDKEFLEYSLNFFFDLFDHFSKLSEEAMNLKKKNSKFKKIEEINPNKFLSLIVKRINIICKFATEKSVSIKKLLDEKVDTLFKLSHSNSVKLRIEVLKLIFMISQGLTTGDQSKPKKLNPDEKFDYCDRYYRSLYEILLIREILFSKHLKELLKLLMMSLSFDSNVTRVAAFLKRLLAMSLHAEPPFITCVLIITSQILRNKHKLWKMIEKANTENNLYDNNKRDPIFTSADSFPLPEIIILTNHYHPTVQKFSKFILENYNKDIISYEGDPLIDFSLVNFLEKFMLKNPKVKKDKKVKKSAANKEEEDLKKFLGEDDDNNNKNINNFEDLSKKENEKTGLQLDFIQKFNEIEKVKSVKYEKNLEKKKKKMKIKETNDIEQFADQVIEEEYKKYDKDIDEDMDFEQQEQEEEPKEDQEEDLENFEDDEWEGLEDDAGEDIDIMDDNNFEEI